MNNENCFLCSDILDDDVACVNLTAKGLAGIINASIQREDEIHKLLNPMSTDVSQSYAILEVICGQQMYMPGMSLSCLLQKQGITKYVVLILGKDIQFQLETDIKSVKKFLHQWDVLMTQLSRELLGTEPYSPRHLQKKLIEWFGNDITISCKKGIPNIVTFGKTVADIISDYHKQTRLEHPNQEKILIIESAAKLIKNEISLLCNSVDLYPSASDIASLEENKRILPPVLQTFLDIIVTKSESDLKKTAIGQAIIHACRSRYFICPIPLGIGVQVHRDFGSRLLIDELYRLGFSVSYDEMHYQQATFPKWVSDNVAHNIVTINDHNTVHGMGIIMCTSGEYGNASFLLAERIKGLKNRLPANEISRKAKIPLHFIQSPSATAMNKVTFESLVYEAIQTKMLDVLWITSFLPMIDLHPVSHNCVYTTLKFVCEEAKRLNVATPIVTFDQLLWIKAMEVICSNHEGEFDNMAIRLGGFHTLMSFLETIGDLMSGSGIEEVLETVYSENTVPHMLTGKAYSHALRRHFLISSTLIAIIIADILKCSPKIEDMPIQMQTNVHRIVIHVNLWMYQWI
ncbi:hypothetical protein PR048_007417 [Dryococelus australis]|uniref:Uncharacterized protein n=1 Tax=Dryococelus australis TaxID=614101 RepID=A0ABQ9HVV0_9NEOP|nr:hypothetical protein PR048_007417 [Dryococelus australis]